MLVCDRPNPACPLDQVIVQRTQIYQALHGLNLIGKATLNVLEPGGLAKSSLLRKSDLTSVTSISALARKSREAVSSGAVDISRLDPGDSHSPPVVVQCMINICVAQYLIYSSRLSRDHVQRVRRLG